MVTNNLVAQPYYCSAPNVWTTFSGGASGPAPPIGSFQFDNSGVLGGFAHIFWYDAPAAENLNLSVDTNTLGTGLQYDELLGYNNTIGDEYVGSYTIGVGNTIGITPAGTGGSYDFAVGISNAIPDTVGSTFLYGNANSIDAASGLSMLFGVGNTLTGSAFSFEFGNSNGENSSGGSEQYGSGNILSSSAGSFQTGFSNSSASSAGSNQFGTSNQATASATSVQMGNSNIMGSSVSGFQSGISGTMSNCAASYQMGSHTCNGGADSFQVGIGHVLAGPVKTPFTTNGFQSGLQNTANVSVSANGFFAQYGMFNLLNDSPMTVQSGEGLNANNCSTCYQSGNTNSVTTNPSVNFFQFGQNLAGGNGTGPTIALGSYITATKQNSLVIGLGISGHPLTDLANNEICLGANTDTCSLVLENAGGSGNISPVRVVGTLKTGSSSGTDLAGVMTASSGTATYSFTGTYSTAPVCMVQDDTTISNLLTKTVSTTTLTATTVGASDNVSYICVGQN
jgi:hypothetical protein